MREREGQREREREYVVNKAGWLISYIHKRSCQELLGKFILKVKRGIDKSKIWNTNSFDVYLNGILIRAR